MAKFAILAHARKEDLGRATQSLVYTKQLHKAGHEVKVYFEGEATILVL